MTSAAGERGEEGLRGRRMVREAVQDDRRSTIGIAALQRVKGAVWQVEGDAFELHVCQPFQEWSDDRCCGVSRPVG